MRNKSKPTRAAKEASELLRAAAEWCALHDQRVARIQDWQTLETQLFTKTKRRGIAIEACLDTNLPEVEAMNALDRRIAELDQLTEELAAKILLLPVDSLAEAIATIEVGLKIQGSEDWQPNALELVENGLGALRKPLG